MSARALSTIPRLRIRTRRRRRWRPPRDWYYYAFIFVAGLGTLFVDALRWSQNGEPRGALHVGADVLLVTVGRLGMRESDPEHPRGRSWPNITRNLTLVAGAVALNVAAWVLR